MRSGGDLLRRYVHRAVRLVVPAVKAKLFACMKGEMEAIRTLLDAGEAAPDARIEELKAEQWLGTSIIESFRDGCCIATAAYGTSPLSHLFTPIRRARRIAVQAW